jgi:hypothetical protein
VCLPVHHQQQPQMLYKMHMTSVGLWCATRAPWLPTPAAT